MNIPGELCGQRLLGSNCRDLTRRCGAESYEASIGVSDTTSHGGNDVDSVGAFVHALCREDLRTLGWQLHLIFSFTDRGIQCVVDIRFCGFSRLS